MNLICGCLLLSVVFALSSAGKFRKCENGKPTEPLPPTAKDTTDILKNLREVMKANSVDAYIIPAADQHLSEYTSARAKRRAFVSGFKGSAGTAVVTLSKAALWTDGRYFDQGEMELDCNWILQKLGNKGVPRINDWLISEMKAGNKVGIDPKLLSYNSWETRAAALKKNDINLVAVDKNLVDEIWTNRPAPEKTKISVLETKYTGKSWQSKVNDVRTVLHNNSLDAVVFSDLADVAWLLNMRGTDIPYNPFFFGYVLVTQDKIWLFVDNSKLDQITRDHLCPDPSVTKDCVVLKDYDLVKASIKDYTSQNPKAILSIGKGQNYFLAEGINSVRKLLAYSTDQIILIIQSQLYFQTSPVTLPKSMKNEVEQEGMRIANLKDSVAITQFFSWLEKELKSGETVYDEMSASAKLTEFKSRQKDFKGLSFNTISAFGPNAATIHYRPDNFTKLDIDLSGPYLLDSGCQFPEGSTDITRTFHFGKPTEFERSSYTKVLQGTIDLISAIFPMGTYGSKLDVFARSALWEEGLNYNHGTGHGIGHYLSIHEGPQAISSGFNRPNEAYLRPGMVLSDEPGYYETGKFGIRLETDMIVVPANTKYNFGGKQFLKFEAITFVPFCNRLTNTDMLTIRQKMWLNEYNKLVRKKVGDELKKISDDETYDWMMKETEPIEMAATSHFSSAIKSTAFSTLISVILAFYATALMIL